jgi:Zn-dependent metalloprotease
MRKINLLLALLCFTSVLFAQVKPSIDYLQSERQTPLQAEDISPMNASSLQMGVPQQGLRFPVGTNQSFQALPSFSTHPDVENGLHFVRTPDTQLPYFIKGTPNNLDVSASLDEQALQYLEIISDEMQIQKVDEEFIQKSKDTDNLGITHTRFDQYFQGIKVYDGEVILHAKNGVTHLFNGRFFPTPELADITPTLSEAAAVQKVKDAVGGEETVQVTEGFEFLIAGETVTTEIVIYHPQARIDSERLTYHITYIPTLADRWEYFVDAKTGEILNSYNNVCRFHNHNHKSAHSSCSHSKVEAKKEATATPNVNILPPGQEIANANDLLGQSRTIHVYETGGTYFMIDAARTEMFNAAQSTFPDEGVGVIWTIDGMNNNVEGNNFQLSHVTDSDNAWNNPGGVSAHFNGGAAFEYFQDVHNRTSINGEGGNIVSIINVQDGSGPMDNAFWNGSAIFYGNGSTAFKPLARGLDVAGHEMSHGVVQATANLEYQGESGALNESFADIFGAMIDRDDWQIGEDVVELAEFPSGALRDMANPNQGGNNLNDPGYQPAHTDDQYLGSQDNGGVHINSGISNKAFQLFATSVGKDKAEEIYYRALTNYLVRSSQFIDCRASVEQAAADLYGNTEVQAAQSAFNAVGIGSGGATGGGANGGNSQNDFEPNPGQDYILYSDVQQTLLKLYRADGVVEADPFTTNPPISKPSITDDGTAITYIAQDKTMQLIVIDWDAGTYSQSVLNSDPIWRNIAVARDGTRVAALTDDNDNRVYVYDFTLEEGVFFTLYNPTYTEGISTGDVIYADVLEWDFSGNWVLYDAFNRLDGTFGSDIEYWDIGFINVFDHDGLAFSDGTVEKLFSGLPENVSIGNPTFAKNSNYIIAFDVIDQTEAQTQYSLRAANVESGDVGIIFENGRLSYPNYSPDDTNIVFDAATDTDDVLAIVPIADDKISASGENAFVFQPDGHWGVWFAQGDRDFTDTDNLPISAAGVKLAPNPFTDNVQVSFDLEVATEVRFDLTDVTGKVIKTEIRSSNTGFQTYDLNFGQIANGTYFLRISAEGGTAVSKLVKF